MRNEIGEPRDGFALEKLNSQIDNAIHIDAQPLAGRCSVSMSVHVEGATSRGVSARAIEKLHECQELHGCAECSVLDEIVRVPRPYETKLFNFNGV